MKRVLVTGAGGAPAANFIRSLREAPEPFYLIGVDCNTYSLQRAETDERHLVPEPTETDYLPVLRSIIADTRAEFVYPQPDHELRVVSLHREQLGARTFLPDHQTVELCQDKYESFLRWKRAGLTVPDTVLVRHEADLAEAFTRFGAPVWLRAVVSPGAGKGSFRAQTPAIAKAWIDFHTGWGHFTAAECLEPGSVTWTSLWHRGRLIVAQGRRRLSWEFANRAPSGVTGITGTGITVSDPTLDTIAEGAIRAVDARPHGIFSVDLTYDKQGVPNPTEINIGRFFTTHLFFTRAGLNLPHLLIKLAFGEPLPALPRPRNPLPPGLVWIRGMDCLPILTDVTTVEQCHREFQARRTSCAS